MAHRSFGEDAIATDEKHMVITSASYQGGGPLVIVGHGAGDDAWVYANPAYRGDLEVLADAGCVVISADLAGPSFGNDDFLDAVDDTITWAASAWDANTTSVSWIGDSMNAGGALNWAWRNTSQIGGLALRVPAVAYDNIYDRAGFIADLMDDAYAGDWAGNAADRDPTAITDLIVPFAWRVRLYYSTNDPLVSKTEDIDPFVDATGVRAVPLGAVGHDPATVYPAVHAQSQAQFILSQI